MSIFIGKVLFKAEKILTIVFPSFFVVLRLAKLSKRFAYPLFISIGLISSEEIKSPGILVLTYKVSVDTESLKEGEIFKVKLMEEKPKRKYYFVETESLKHYVLLEDNNPSSS